MTRNVLPSTLAAAALSVLIASVPARADVLFDFNLLADGANNAAIQTYMNQQLTSQLGAGKTVVVSGAAVEKDYTGDDHVVGPVSGHTVTSLTLGNSDGTVQHGGAYDSYIYNADSVKFTMTFNFAIYGASFDYEIFPNANCSNPQSTPGEKNVDCSVFPDFTFKAGNGVSMTTYLYKLAVDPDATAINGYQSSPDSGWNKDEKAAQFLGVSGPLTLPGVTVLEFYDWPERVAIDNLVLKTTPPNSSTGSASVPEPATLAMVGIGLVGLARRRFSR